MWGAVIVMTPFESAVRGSLEGSHGDRFHADSHTLPATALVTELHHSMGHYSCADCVRWT